MLPHAMRGTALSLTRAFAAALPAAFDRSWYDRVERRSTASDPDARRRARSLVVGGDRRSDD
jgi:hypothetical protein